MKKYSLRSVCENARRRYPQTIMACLILTALFITYEIAFGDPLLRVLTDSGTEEARAFDVKIFAERALRSLGVLALCAFAGEKTAEKRGSRRHLFHALSLGIGAGAAFVSPGARLGMALAAGLLCLRAILIGRMPERDAADALQRGIASGLAAQVLITALLVCVYAVYALFWGGLDISLALMCVTAFAGFTVFPVLFTGTQDDENDRAGHIVSLAAGYGLLPVFMLYIALLIGYTVLILVKREMPDGAMSPLSLIAYALQALFMVLLTGNENRLCGFWRKWGRLFFIPVVVCQGIGIAIRVNAYGLTDMRIALIALSVVMAAMLITGRVKWVFTALAVLSVLLLCTPLADLAAGASQRERAMRVLTRYDMLDADGVTVVMRKDVPEEELKKLASCVYYLTDKGTDDPFTEALREQKRDKDSDLCRLLEMARGSYEFIVFRGVYEENAIDCAGYSRAEKISLYRQTEDGQYEVGGCRVPVCDILDRLDRNDRTVSGEPVALGDGRLLLISGARLYDHGLYEELVAVYGWIVTPMN